MDEKRTLKNLGINIKAARLKKGISQEEIAEMTFMSRNSISLIETGKINPTILKMLYISKALDVDLNTLVENI